MAKKTFSRKFEFTIAEMEVARAEVLGGAVLGVNITLLVLTPDVKKLPKDFAKLAHALLYEDAAMKQRK